MIADFSPSRITRFALGGWREGAAGRNTCCSSRGPEFHSQHPHGTSQLLIKTAPRDQTLMQNTGKKLTKFKKRKTLVVLGCSVSYLFFKIHSLSRVVVVHIFNPSTRDRDRLISEFEVGLVYRVSSRTARAMQRNCLKKTTKKLKTISYSNYVCLKSYLHLLACTLYVEPFVCFYFVFERISL